MMFCFFITERVKSTKKKSTSEFQVTVPVLVSFQTWTVPDPTVDSLKIITGESQRPDEERYESITGNGKKDQERKTRARVESRTCRSRKHSTRHDDTGVCHKKTEYRWVRSRQINEGLHSERVHVHTSGNTEPKMKLSPHKRHVYVCTDARDQIVSSRGEVLV